MQVERIFRQSSEFCSEHDVWKLNVAHTFFMQVCGFRTINMITTDKCALWYNLLYLKMHALQQFMVN